MGGGVMLPLGTRSGGRWRGRSGTCRTDWPSTDAMRNWTSSAHPAHLAPERLPLRRALHGPRPFLSAFSRPADGSAPEQETKFSRSVGRASLLSLSALCQSRPLQRIMASGCRTGALRGGRRGLRGGGSGDTEPPPPPSRCGGGGVGPPLFEGRPPERARAPGSSTTGPVRRRPCPDQATPVAGVVQPVGSGSPMAGSGAGPLMQATMRANMFSARSSSSRRGTPVSRA